MKNSIVILLIFTLIVLGCGQERGQTTEPAANTSQSKSESLDPSERFHALVEPEMTLAEVAKANRIVELFLKQKLGIPQYINHPYTILELSRNYKFSVDDLIRIIEVQKDKKTIENKKRQEKKKNNN